ncbi:MAG TPA: sugar phosphate isomerase/epimerase [Propionibacteriaceae bacterium]|nr:sugar phosphate isomerase/epimerase [Propionibacteriaceae bacterium]
MTIDPRLGCSTISFRRWPLSGALAEIKAQGFGETDLGSLPGVCDHVPIPLPADRVDALAGQILDSGVAVRLINADVADMDDPDLDAAVMQRRLRTLVDLAQAVGTSTIMLPCGRQGTEPRTELSRDIATVARTLSAAADFVNAAGLDLLVEAPHSRRLCATVERSEMLYDALRESPVGAVLDFSHVVASGDDEVDAVRRIDGRIGHVHLRDAVLGDINLSIGRGKVNFPAAIEALTTSGYQGHYSLELETHDIEDADRPTEAGRAGRYITSLLQR